MDKSTTQELIDFVYESLQLIKRRFEKIENSDDFLKDDEGLDRLDSISMRVQAIGEALKNLDKRDKNFLMKVADEKYWSNIIRTRDILSHHYIDIDAETIFMICDEKLDELEAKILKLKELL